MAATPSAQYSLTLRVEIDHRPGMLGKVASAIGEAGGTIGAVDLLLGVEESAAVGEPRGTAVLAEIVSESCFGARGRRGRGVVGRMKQLGVVAAGQHRDG